MYRFQLKVVSNDRASLRERRLPSESTWRFETHSRSASRCKTPCFRRSPVRNGVPPLKMFQPHRALWSRSPLYRPIICLRPTLPQSSSPSLRKHAASRRPGAVTPYAQALAPTNRCGSSIINAARHLTRSRPLPALKPGSRSSRSSCSIMLQPSMPWSRGYPRRRQNDAWPLTSSPDMVRFA